MANKKDFAIGIVANAPGTTGLSLEFQPGYGATMPAVPFYLTLTPPGQLTTLGNSEKVLVTARTSTEIFTITRAQTPTTAKNIAAGWIAANSVYTDDVTGFVKQLGFVNRDNSAKTIAATSNTWYNVRNTADTADLSLSVTPSGTKFYLDVSLVVWADVNAYKNLRILVDGAVGSMVPSVAPMSYLLNGVAPGMTNFEITTTAGAHTLTFQIQSEGVAGNLAYRQFFARAYEIST
jgi:hypothetical protein